MNIQESARLTPLQQEEMVRSVIGSWLTTTEAHWHAQPHSTPASVASVDWCIINRDDNCAAAPAAVRQAQALQARVSLATVSRVSRKAGPD